MAGSRHDMQRIEHFVSHSTGWFLAAGMAIAFLGIFLGRRVLKKHLKELA